MNYFIFFFYNNNWIFFVDIIFLDVVKIEELEDIFYFCLVLELI